MSKENERKAQNIRGARGVSGEWFEEPVRTLSVQRKTVFSINAKFGLEPESLCGDLIDILIGLCFSGPEYLCQQDAARHIALLREFKQFNCTLWWNSKNRTVAVERIPLKFLGNAAVQWIESCFDDERCALLPSYALDTAIFIDSHVSGHYQIDPKWWEIEPLVPFLRREIHSLIDNQFKKNFTSRFGGTLVSCAVPEGCAVMFQEKPLIQAGQEFFAEIRRCHLSTTVDEYGYLYAEGPKPQLLDLGFDFVGDTLLAGESSLMDWFTNSVENPLFPYNLITKTPFPDRVRTMRLQFPGQWVHSSCEGSRGDFKLLPVPNWEAEIS